MRKIIILLLASLFLLFSCDLGVGENPLKKALSSNRIPEDFLGLCHAGYANISNDSDTVMEYDFIKYLGAKWTLMDITWTTVEPTDDAWNFGHYDKIINTANANGVKVFAVMAYENNTVTGDSGRYIRPEKFEEYAEYVAAAIQYYGERVAGYSIWNEPNENPRFWTGTPEEIITLSLTAVGAARLALAQYNPNGKLIAWPVNSLAVDAWTDGFFGAAISEEAQGAILAIDAVAYHPYMPGGQRSADLFSAHQNLVSKYGFDRKIWVTEAGFPTGGQYVSRVEEDCMPEEVIKTITLLAARGAAHVFWYQLFDDRDVGDDSFTSSEEYFGLGYFKKTPNTGTITKKKGADAFALCGKYIPGTLYRPDLSVTGSGVQAYWFEGAEESALILWADTKAVGDTVPVTVTLPGTGWTRHNIEAEVGADGSGTAVSDATATYNVGKTPVFLTWKPTAKVPSVSAP
jgi:hypothetical protein